MSVNGMNEEEESNQLRQISPQWILANERWIKLFLPVALIICLAVGWRHLQQERILQQTIYAHDTLNQVRVALATGTLHLEISVYESSAAEKATGMAALEQATRRLETIIAPLEALQQRPALLTSFQQDVADVQEALMEWGTTSISSVEQMRVQRSMLRYLDQQINELDSQIVQIMDAITLQISITFWVTAIGLTLLLLILCSTIIYGRRLHQKSERALHQQEEQLRILTQTIPVIAWAIDIDGSIQFMNQRWQTLTGRSVESSLGREWMTAFHPDERPMIQVVLQQARESTKPVDLIHRLQSKAGDYRWQRSQGAPQYDQNGLLIGWHGVTADIHELHSAEHALHESEERLRLGTNAAGLAITEIDYRQDVLYITKEIATLFGLPAGTATAIPRTDILALVHPDDQPALLAQMEATLDPSSSGLFAMECRIIQPDSSIRWLNIHKQNFFEETEEGQLRATHALFAAQDITKQRQIEEALREERDRFQKIVDTVPGVIHTFENKADGTPAFSYASPRIEEIYGVRPEDLKEDASFTLDLCHPDDRAQLLDSITYSLQTMGNWHHIFRVHHPSKGEIWVEGHSSPKRQADGSTLYYGVLTDISERKAVEDALRLSEERLQTVIDNLTEGLILFDPSGAISYWNRAALALHGFASIEESFSVVTDFEHAYELLTLDGQIVPVEQWPTSRLLRNESIDEQILCIRHVDNAWERIFTYGGSSVLNEQGHLVIFLTVTDITDRKQTERALIETVREKEQALAQLDAIFSAAPIGLGFWDRDLHFLRLNQSLAEINELPIEAQIGRHIAEIVPDLVDAQAMVAAWQQVLETGEPLLNVEISGKTKSKPQQPRYWIDNFFPVQIGDEIIGIGATVLDITERKLAEQEVAQFNNQLEQRVAERTAQVLAVNEELESFAYSVSHDLRSPLRAIDGYTRILLDDYAVHLDEEATRIATVVCNEAKRMGQLIDDLLAFSRLSRAPLQKVPVEMTQLAQTVYDELSVRENTVDLTLKLHPLPTTLGDPTMMRQVWQNLLGNAIKFSQKQPHAEIEVKAIRGEGEIIYSIRDNGAGFDMRYANKLFGVFQRLHSNREFPGTGVGLAIVQRIIHRHGGRVWAESVIGAGATFYIALPHDAE